MKDNNCIYFNYASPTSSSFMYREIGLDIPTNIFYVNYKGVSSFYVPFFEYEYLKKYANNSTTIKNIDELLIFGDNYFDAIINFLKQMNKGVVKVPGLFPSWFLIKMIKAGLDVKIEDFNFIYPLIKKNSMEIRAMKKTGSVVKASFANIENILNSATVINGCIYYKNKKLSSEGLSRIIELFFLEKNIRCGFVVVSCGKYSYYPHCKVNHLLRANETIIIDLAVRGADGYYIDATRTYCVGEPYYHDFINLYRNIKEVKREIEKDMQPGKIISKVYEKTMDMMSKVGIKDSGDNCLVCHHSIGHGIGRDLHQLPVIDSKAKISFEKNMVIAIEPGAYIKDLGGIRIEDTYLITNNGIDNLTFGRYKFLINKK
ncbi:MAG: M24 family metallopeptidase [Candidatus Pacebacteria bacterium]|nr:M24 family metallopeptidase [Candidatus Paceibacterota bacterium]